MLKEFPSDLMLRDLHFTRELRTAIRKRAEKIMSYGEIGLIVRKEFAEWLKAPGTIRQAMIAQPLAVG